MSEQLDFKELAQRAQRGDKGALDRLAELASKRLRVYVYRLTLQDDLTSEIVQETLLEMCRIIGKLRQTDRFLPWLYGIATNKLRHFYRSEQTMRRATASKSDMEQGVHTRHEGLENLVGQELKEIVGEAIQNLKTNHRAVLIMRCYDGMSYAEIAESMGSTEFGTRMLFLRAKKSLQKQLARQGLGKGTLLAALVLFGRMTAPTKVAAAEISISAATVQAGTAAGLAAAATGKATLLSLAAAGAITVGGVVHQARTVELGSTYQGQGGHWSLLDGGASNQRHEKHWHYLPKGKEGPVFTRAQVDEGAQDPSWVILQNTRGNYLYDGSRLTINNAHWYARDGRVMRLPYDNEALHSFLDQVEGTTSYLPTERVRRPGALVTTLRTAEGYAKPTVVYNNNVLEEDFFLSDLVSQTEGLDMRDRLHQQGWACFRVSGYLEGQSIRGNGQLPLIYDAMRKCPPWIRLQIGDTVVADSSHGAWLEDKATGEVIRYPAYSFFAGLPRPWMGLHIVDTVRRDAAEQELWFTSDFSDTDSKARITVDMGDTRAIYTVDLENDLLDRITLEQQGKVVGELVFTYSATSAGGSVSAPSRRSSGSQEDRPGLAWLMELTQTELAR